MSRYALGAASSADDEGVVCSDMSRPEDKSPAPAPRSGQGIDDPPVPGGTDLDAVIADRDDLLVELAETRQCAESDMKALSEDSDRYIAEIISEHEEQQAGLADQVRQLEAQQAASQQAASQQVADQLGALQQQVDDHAIERYELVQARDAATRALAETTTVADQLGLADEQREASEGAVLSELEAELARATELADRLAAERDEALATIEQVQATSAEEQEGLIAELIESHHEEVEALAGELDTVSAAALQSEQELEAARADLAILEQRLAAPLDPRSTPPLPPQGNEELQRLMLDAETELRRVQGENAVLQQLLQEAQGQGAALQPPSADEGLGAPQESFVSGLDDQSPDIAIPAYTADGNGGGSNHEMAELALEAPQVDVEEWAFEPEMEPVAPPQEPLQPASAGLELEVPQPAVQAAGYDAGEAALGLVAPAIGPPAENLAPVQPDWGLEMPRVSSEVPTDPPREEGFNPAALELGDPSPASEPPAW
ncbi:MAG: hypothetical protein DRI90_05680, partial [Deltaproteobacteria bacterium]